MNTNLLNAINALKTEHGADILDNPGALEQLFETAREEPRAQIKTLITACIRDFQKELQNAAGTERAAYKERLAQKLHNDEALDLTYCKNTLDLIEAALFGAAAPVCARCGAELKAHWKACPECGTAVQAAGGGQAAVAPNETPRTGEDAEIDAIIKKAEECDANYDDAIKILTEGIERFPDSAKLYFERGFSFYLQKPVIFAGLAIKDLNKAIELAPNYTEAYI